MRALCYKNLTQIPENFQEVCRTRTDTQESSLKYEILQTNKNKHQPIPVATQHRGDQRIKLVHGGNSIRHIL